MQQHEFKPGGLPPSYEETYMPRANRDSGIRQVQTTMPWWNPRYWRKRVWAGLVAAILIIVVIAVAVGVTQSKNNAYPDYTTLSYSLSETCELIYSVLIDSMLIKASRGRVLL